MTNEKSSTNQLPILYGVIGLLVGVLIAILFARNAVNNNMGDMMRMMGIREKQGISQNANEMMENMMGGHRMSMDDMAAELEGKTGDDFDKTFIDLMIEHHQGAIDMANLAKVNAKHQEIKDLSGAIIEAQTKEINEMSKWKRQWGY